MNTYNKSGRRDRHLVGAWSGGHLAAKLLANMADRTAAAYMHALNTAGTINLPPLPPLNFAQPVSLIPGSTRVPSTDVVFYHYVNGGQAQAFYGGKDAELSSLKSQPPMPTAPPC